jgi:predicted AlkP superfamily pyrophosphatase or phosphodiesterase
VKRRTDERKRAIKVAMLRLLRLLIPAVAVLAAVLATAPGRAQEPAPAVADDPSKPLVYVFSLDALDGDRAIDQGRAPFLARLVRGEEGGQATYYRESRGIMVSETNPNHVAMATGAYGERSGIPGNTFAVHDAAGQRGCPADGGSVDPFSEGDEDPTVGEAVVTSGEAASCLLAETFFTALERRAPDVVTAGLFGKPKLARIFETKLVDAGSFDADFLYAPCEQRSSDPPYCKDDPIDPIQRYTEDEFVMEEVIRTVNEGVRTDDGAMRRPNVTFVNFPDIDQTGHATGAREAYEAQILRTDRQLQAFVENQKERGLWQRTIIFFVSDHSMDSTPPNLGTNSLERAFGEDADAVEVVLNGSVDMVYLKDRDRPDRHALLKRLRDKAVAQGFVDEALYRLPNPVDGGDRFTLDAVHPGWHIAGERTGDLLVTAKTMQSFGEPVNPLNGNHGAPQTLDHAFAIVSGGGQVRQQALAGRQAARFDDTLLNPRQAEQVDIAPTVMALFGQAPPADNQGRVLTEARSRPARCRASAAEAAAREVPEPADGATRATRPRGRATSSPASGR